MCCMYAECAIDGVRKAVALTDALIDLLARARPAPLRGLLAQLHRRLRRR